jgi:hypothetical protein
MSADNGIYIAKFPDGYRVTNSGAIENCWYYPEDSVDRKQTLKDYFGDSPLFPIEEEALLYAYKLSKEGYTEYGVLYIGEFESFEEV